MQHLSSGKVEVLKVSDVDPQAVFDAYFNEEPPFDLAKKKFEFPDAFTLERLIMWAKEHKTTVYVVGPDDDLKRTCAVRPELEYFNKIEMLLSHVNSADLLVRRLAGEREDIEDELIDFITENFPDLMFVLEYNPHGDVENVSVSEVDVEEIYALKVDQDHVTAEAEVLVTFNADFSYDDMDTASYDKESGQYFVMDEIAGQVEQICRISVVFECAVNKADELVISNLSLREDTIRVREEDRGDYGAYK